MMILDSSLLFLGHPVDLHYNTVLLLWHTKGVVNPTSLHILASCKRLNADWNRPLFMLQLLRFS